MQQLEIPENKKILIIAPHPDDEIFCCSGILLDYAKQCDVLLLTYGEKGNPEWSERKTAKIRKEEFRKVMESLKVHKYIELKFPDGKVKDKGNLLKRFPYGKYDYIFLPNRYDIHVDHNCVYSIVYEKVVREKAKTCLFEYEMWGMLQKPSHFIDITNKIERKKELMMLYESQERHIDYCNRILALGYFRAIEVPPASYIECFYSKAEEAEFDVWKWINRKIQEFILKKE